MHMCMCGRWWLLCPLGPSIAAEVSDSKKPRHVTEEATPLDGGSLEMDTRQVGGPTPPSGNTGLRAYNLSSGVYVAEGGTIQTAGKCKR